MALSLKGRHIIQRAMLAVMLLALVAPLYSTNAEAQTITAYKAQYPVKLNGVVSQGEWNDTPMISIPAAGMTIAFKQNGTGLLFLLIWDQSSSVCYDKYCFGGIEIGNLNNSGGMGTPATPTIMILLSPSFKEGYDEFISYADQTPETVENAGYATQSTCALGISGITYTAECYRPFHLVNASPYDPFPSLVAGSPIEIGFAVGEFSVPGLHSATDMSSYVLTLSNELAPVQTTTAYTGSSQSATTGQPTTSQTAITTTTPISFYGLVRQYGPYLPLAAIIIAAVHFVRRKGWTGESPW